MCCCFQQKLHRSFAEAIQKLPRSLTEASQKLFLKATTHRTVRVFLRKLESFAGAVMQRRFRQACPLCGRPDLKNISTHLLQVHGLQSKERKPYLKQANVSSWQPYIDKSPYMNSEKQGGKQDRHGKQHWRNSSRVKKYLKKNPTPSADDEDFTSTNPIPSAGNQPETINTPATDPTGNEANIQNQTGTNNNQPQEETTRRFNTQKSAPDYLGFDK
ncbi:Hypothetical predicted protein [Paramuricea clavata]|uniref:Uncharacterized protein n=1 Tax=Paramuricea clavata TaxID=317549 RepID=A0A6S7KFZ3_PARCT|nr:Hypothetical predicted protein [Paramuricea clavata]